MEGVIMSVEIIIERKFKGAPFLEHLHAIDDLRMKAMKQKGYIRGETLVNLEDQREVVVLSFWSSLDDWKTWLNSEERQKMENELASYLEEPVRIRSYMPTADYVKEAFAKLGHDG
jgi:heme-degrading monooxygenase HmoA